MCGVHPNFAWDMLVRHAGEFPAHGAIVYRQAHVMEPGSIVCLIQTPRLRCDFAGWAVPERVWIYSGLARARLLVTAKARVPHGCSYRPQFGS